MPTKLITSLNAREMGEKGNAAKRARIQELRDAVEDAYNSTDFMSQQLSRIRAEIRRHDELLSKAKEPRDLQAISTSMEKLYKIEQSLAMRPGPGNLKPSNTPPPKPSMPDPVD